MIKGIVNLNAEPTLTVEISGSGGEMVLVDAILDTGFSGDLLLPSETIKEAALDPLDQITAALADGSLTTMNTGLGTIQWHGQPRSVVVLESDGHPLIGMNLLRGNRVIMDVIENGAVIIEELDNP